ncbi:hypothetical protein ACFPYI_14250 [Halomarina salina]|uniref:PGF-pre-PGF domain-containing protein n=1 Tax=Halomarina salina TaxID=1872699 RepID=A0ABD5RQ24_9EURY|nr:hypothetical protein [Halomarina salina]
MPSRRRLLGLLVVVLVALPVVAPAVARPPPEPLCGTCTMGQDGDGVHGVAVDPATSSVTVESFANGSSRWTERVELRYGADDLAANDTFRAEVVEGALHRHAAGENRIDTRSRVENDTLVTTYRVPNLATRSAGVLTVDLFDRTDRESWAYVGAARATLVAPEGYHLVDGPDGEGETNASAVVWTDDAPAADYGPDVEGRITFAEDGTTASGVRAALVTVQTDAPPLLFGAAALALVPTLLVAAVCVLYVRSRTADDGLGLSPLTVTLVVVAAAFVGLVGTAYVLLFGVSPEGPGVAPLVVVPLAALFAVGYCATTGDRTRQAIGALAVAPWVGVVALVLNGQLASRDWVTVLAVAVGALAVTAVGVPGYLAGRRLAPGASKRD